MLEVRADPDASRRRRLRAVMIGVLLVGTTVSRVRRPSDSIIRPASCGVCARLAERRAALIANAADVGGRSRRRRSPTLGLRSRCGDRDAAGRVEPEE
jgi:hypothetical protein